MSKYVLGLLKEGALVLIMQENYQFSLQSNYCCSKYLSFRIALILLYLKGEKIDHLWWPFLRVYARFGKNVANRLQLILTLTLAV